MAGGVPQIGSSGQPATNNPFGSGSVIPYLQGAQNANQQFVNGKAVGPNNSLLSQYYNAAAAPMIQQFQQATDPSILGGAVQSGNLYGSAPQQNEYNAQTALAQGLGSLGAGIALPAYEQGQQLRQNAIFGAPSLAQAQYLPAQELGQVGAQQQQLQQSIMGWPFSALSGAAGLLGPATGGSGSVTVGGQGGLK